MKQLKVIMIILSLLSSMSNIAIAISRSEIIANAILYKDIGWTCEKDIETYFTPVYNSDFMEGTTAYGVAYVYGGYDKYSGEREDIAWLNGGYTFTQRIALPVCPGGSGTQILYDPVIEGGYGYGSDVPKYLAGIDCSGYVTRAWGMNSKVVGFVKASL
ncbi:MAG: hypothetical protein JW803_08835 [Endomicrobiales bacterium]|nr:hypothetical protein [Endomicrobiales bacterium]